MSQPSNNPVVQQLQVLLSGTGFNFYSDVNKARADDLLVRQAASARLTSAASAIARLEAQYRAEYVPPSTRAQPFPSTEVMQALRALTALKTRIGDIDARVRGAPAPSQDKVWWRSRGESETLAALLSYDRLLIQGADVVQQTAQQVTATVWSSTEGRTALDAPLAEVESTLQMRATLLQAA